MNIDVSTCKDKNGKIMMYATPSNLSPAGKEYQDLVTKRIQILRAISNDVNKQQRGHLKIFFGYAAGVGKTYAMLKAAHTALRCGIDVAVGYVEPHPRPQTAALLEGLECIPARKIQCNSIILDEFDLDAALKRKTQLILVDELAHTNAAECRHTKRYQDVEELLKAGINVYTTVNVQHIESLNDTVASVTGVMVKERIPDSIFDDADQVELVDIEPDDLLERLKGGNIYKEKQASRAAANFFTIDNLTALREIALCRCADRVNLLTENARIKSHGDYHTDEHILVCLSPAPSNPKIIRTATHMATAFRSTLTALFVETPDFSIMNDKDKNRLRTNIRLAQQLDATIETVYGEDVLFQIAKFARLSGVSKIVIGRSAATRKSFFSKPTLTEKLIALAPNMNIHIIPDSMTNKFYHAKKMKPDSTRKIPLKDIIISVLILLSATLIGFVFYHFGFTESNIITIYILGVLITSIVTTNRICSLISSVVSVLAFNFFFTYPRFTLLADDKSYLITFLIMFISAFITGALAAKLKIHAKQSARAAFRTKVLFDTNQLLQQAQSDDEIITATANQLIKLLDRDIVIYLTDPEELDNPLVFYVSDETRQDIVSNNEKSVAAWVWKNNKHAGATTDTLSNAKCLYLVIRVNDQVYGVIGIVIEGKTMDSFENSVLLSFLENARWHWKTTKCP